MTPKNKRLLVGALLLASVGIWIPQLLGLGSEGAPPVRNDLPALQDGSPGADAGRETAAPAANAGAEVQPVQEASAPAAAPSTSQMLQALERSLAKLKDSSSTTGSGSLDDLALAWDRRQGASRPTSDAGDAPVAVSLPAPAPEPPREPRAPEFDAQGLQAFLDAHPLRLVLLGEHERTARLGARIVHEGDHLLESVRVLRIEADGLTISTPAGDRRVGLAPFEARARQRSGGADSAGPAAAPAVAPATAPAAGAPQPAAPAPGAPAPKTP